jgi:carbon-monoxide dehydrogenase medium subunit
VKACAFDYERARDVSEAVKLLSAEGAKLAAGMQSLGPMLNLRLVQPSLLVDIRRLDELRTIREEGDTLALGACVTHAEIEDGRISGPTGAFLRKVASRIAYRAVRNRGTIGGSLSHADPAADWPSALALLGGAAIVAGPNGRREIPLDRFVTGLFSTGLAGDEIVVSIRLQKLGPKARFGYWKFCRKAGEFAQAIGGALEDRDRGVSRTVIGATAGAPFVETGRGLFDKPDLDSCLAIADKAGLGADAYRRRLHAVALRRALAEAQ